MKVDEELQEKIHQLQIAEQNFQNFSLQKQAFQIELNETDSALREVEKASGDIYKITGQIMVKSTKDDLLKELKEKQKVFSLRVKSIEKQEALLQKKAESLRKELEEKFQQREEKEK